MTVDCIDDLAAKIDTLPNPKLVLTARTPTRFGAFIQFRTRSFLIDTSLEDIRRRFQEYPQDPHIGNLQMIPLALSDHLAAVTAHLEPAGATIFSVFLPVSH